jgi:hypothetical protein
VSERDGCLRLDAIALLELVLTDCAAEGAFVAVNHGDCPLGPMQARLGDPVPLCLSRAKRRRGGAAARRRGGAVA